MGFTWQAALGAVFISGCLFLFVSLFKIRELIITPISLKNAAIVVSSPATFVTMSDPHSPAPVLAMLGFFIIVAG